MGSYSALRHKLSTWVGVQVINKAYVASLPAYFSIILLPPGWSKDILECPHSERY